MNIYADDNQDRPMIVDDPELQEAIDLINDYILAEFDHIGIREGSNLSDVGLLYTTAGDYEEVELQVSANLNNKTIDYYINGDLRGQEKFSSLTEMIDALEGLNWDDLYSACIDFVNDDDYSDEDPFLE